MNRLLIIILGLGMALMARAQEIPNYILPDDKYVGLDEEMMAGFTSLSEAVQRGEDPSFEKVSAIFPHYMDRPKAIVGIKEHRGRFL
ncbi:MAG: hypothetical protein IKH49_08620, partial [Bacteroidales bacterium]|nr:hypothetical protein [Bacteroidales bacterium]